MAGLENSEPACHPRATDHGERPTLGDQPMVTALLSTPTPMSTGSIETCVTHDAVIPFQSSPEAEPIKARGVRDLPCDLVDEFPGPRDSHGQKRFRHPNLSRVRILIATTGVLPPAPVADLCRRLHSWGGASRS